MLVCGGVARIKRDNIDFSILSVSQVGVFGWFRFWFGFYLTYGSRMLIQFAIVGIHWTNMGNNEYLGYTVYSYD